MKKKRGIWDTADKAVYSAVFVILVFAVAFSLTNQTTISEEQPLGSPSLRSTEITVPTTPSLVVSEKQGTLQNFLLKIRSIRFRNPFVGEAQAAESQSELKQLPSTISRRGFKMVIDETSGRRIIELPVIIYSDDTQEKVMTFSPVEGDWITYAGYDYDKSAIVFRTKNGETLTITTFSAKDQLYSTVFLRIVNKLVTGESETVELPYSQ